MMRPERLGWRQALPAVLLCSGIALSCGAEREGEPAVREAATSVGLTGERLAARHCQACHAYPEPGLLGKRSWEGGVLPVMARFMGLHGGGRPSGVAWTFSGGLPKGKSEFAEGRLDARGG